jgi:hypothetical protein
MLSRTSPAPRLKACVLALAMLAAYPARASEGLTVSGRIAYGGIMRTQAPDPILLTASNAAVLGLIGYGNGANADDGNLNYARHDWISRAALANLDLRYEGAGVVGVARVKAWYDDGLRHDARPWGNSINRYTAGQPLSDAGVERLSRFSGVAFGEAWLEREMAIGDAKLLARAGHQLTPWGERGSALEAMGARDMPAGRRAGSVPQEARVAAPMVFARLALSPGLTLEGFVQSFRPSALDVCGSLSALNDYQTPGCDWIMVGPPLGLNDRARMAAGAVMERLPTRTPDSPNRGLALLWKASADTELGFFHTRYGWRLPMPNVRRSTRVGPPLIPGNPDGLNMTFFTDHPGNLGLSAMTLNWRAPAATTVNAELSWREGIPFMLSPADVLPAFFSATAPSMLRADVNALAPGAVLHGYDQYSIAQLQLGAQRRWDAFGVPLTGLLEVQYKHTPGLPDQSVRRYGRNDVYGPGPVNGVCMVSTGDAARQCSLRGYQTANALGYRLRMEARLPEPMPGLAPKLSANFSHDVRGWSGDFALNEGRKMMVLGCQLEYRKRYFVELSYLGVWGGDYNSVIDRDAVSLSAGLRF